MKNKQKNMIHDIHNKTTDEAHREFAIYRMVLTDETLIKRFARISDYEKIYNAFLENQMVEYDSELLQKTIQNLADIEKEVIRITRNQNNHDKVYPVIIDQVTQNKPKNAIAYTEFYKEILPLFQRANNLEALITCLPTKIDQPVFMKILTTYVTSNQQTMDEFTMTDRIVKACHLMEKKQNSLTFASNMNQIFHQGGKQKQKK